jgi:hypothetical protein
VAKGESVQLRDTDVDGSYAAVLTYDYRRLEAIEADVLFYGEVNGLTYTQWAWNSVVTAVQEVAVSIVGEIMHKER